MWVLLCLNTLRVAELNCSCYRVKPPILTENWDCCFMCQFPFLENLFKCHWDILESNSSSYRWLLLLVLLERGKRSKFKKTACSSSQPVPSLCHSKPHLVSFRSLLPLPNAGTHPQMPYNCPTKKGEGMVGKFAKSVRAQDPTPFFEKEMQDVLKSPSPQPTPISTHRKFGRRGGRGSIPEGRA